MTFGRQIGRWVALVTIFAQLFFCGGAVAFAQEASGEAPAPVEAPPTEPAPTTDIPAVTPPPSPAPEPEVTLDTTPVTDEGSADLQGASSTPQLQETFSDQDPVNVNETTEDQEVVLATTTDEVLPPADDDTTAPDTASTTDEAPTTEEPTEPVPDEVPPPEEVVVPTEEPTVPAVEPPVPTEPERAVENAPIVISRHELRPSAQYTFSINSGKHITTNRKTHRERTVRGKVVVEEVKETLSAPPQIAVDNTSGVMTVSGSCSDKYFVVLVYRNATDYDANKRTAIFNRAFPCENGTYSYDIVNLPQSLEDGTYYLLVAGMGENTPWEPITGLSEIQLHRNN